MSRKAIATVGSLFGLFACFNLCLYITTCGWQPRELLTVITILLAAFDCGLFLSQLIKW